MIERMVWPNSVGSEPESPFQPNATRPLRLTFHESSFSNLPPEEARALQALRELAQLKQIEAVATSPGSLPCIKIEIPDHDKKDVGVRMDDDSHHTGLMHFGQWKDLARHASQQHDEKSPQFSEALQEVLLAGASNAIRHDIFVTASPTLLSNKGKVFIRHANVRSPSEAARIAGLFLRSRGTFTYGVGGSFSHSFDRGLFYWVLTRYRLPKMWHYFSACLDGGKVRKDDTDMVGQSILARCDRALEARDNIVRLLYVPQDNNIRDEMMYHFDYLTLLLAGAIDAQARVAHRAYKITASPERVANFRRQDFQTELNSAGATKLVQFVTSPLFINASTLLSRLRNTIHGASMPTLAYNEGGEPQKSFIQVTSEHRDELWAAAEGLGSAARWGLRKSHDRVLLEPCSYATALVAEIFKCVNEIADATDLIGLFPTGHAIRHYPGPPADDRIFGTKICERLDVLG